MRKNRQSVFFFALHTFMTEKAREVDDGGPMQKRAGDTDRVTGEDVDVNVKVELSKLWIDLAVSSCHVSSRGALSTLTPKI